jgi:hypothetical protein
VASRRPFVAALVPPLAGWAAALGGLWSIAFAAGYDPFRPRTWARWDSALYLDIARNGYDLFRCPASYGPRTWCGDAAWFPGYPWLLRGSHALGAPLLPTALILSWLLAGATLVLLWNTFLGRRIEAGALVALVYAAWAPGQIYDYAVFPLSLLAFCTVAHLWLLHRGRWRTAGVAGAAAVLAYPIGIVLIVVSAVWAALEARRGRVRALASTLLPMVVALLAIAAVQRAETGSWVAFFRVQRKYGHGLHDPLGLTWNSIVGLFRGGAPTRADAPAAQTLLVTVVLGATLLMVALRRRQRTSLDVLLALWAIATWALPLGQANVSLHRSQAALLPISALVSRLPRWSAVTVTAVAVALSVPIALLFFHGRLV